MRFKNPFLWKHYEKLLIVPIVLMAISLFCIFVFPKVTYGLDFKGGTMLTIMTSASNPDVSLLKQTLEPFASSVDVRSFSSPDGAPGIEIELGPSETLEKATATARDLDVAKSDFDAATLELTSVESQAQAGTASPTQIEDAQKKVASAQATVLSKSAALMDDLGDGSVLPSNPSQAYQVARDKYSARQESYQSEVLAAVKSVVPISSYSAKEVGSSLSHQFLNKVVEILFYSFLLSTIFVFVVFRSALPSFAVVFGAVADIVITLGVMAVLGLPLTLASFAALLMLIAFSFDTDMLLTVRVLKRTDGTAKERAFAAMKTALLINVATVLSYSVLLAASALMQISVYYQIASVAVIGGLADFIATWFGNAVIILHFKRD